MNDIDASLRAIHRAAKGLREEDYGLLLVVLEQLSRVLDERNATLARRRALRQIINYLKTKADTQDPKVLAQHESSIRHIRNLFVHNKSISPADLRLAYPLFWQILGKTAKDWDGDDLNNLLAYSVRVKPLERDHRISNSRVINYYKSYFNTLPEDSKERVFREALLRVYSEPPFRRFVEHQSLGEK